MLTMKIEGNHANIKHSKSDTTQKMVPIWKFPEKSESRGTRKLWVSKCPNFG
jgi:hypothetical protein